MRCAVHRMSGKGSNCLNSDMITRVNARAGGDMELLLASGDDDYGRFGSCGSTVTDDGLTIKEIAHPVRRISGNSLPDMGQNIWKDRIGGSTPDALEAGSTYSVHSTHSQHDTESVSKHHSDEGQVKVTACFRIDPKLDFIPEWA